MGLSNAANETEYASTRHGGECVFAVLADCTDIYPLSHYRRRRGLALV